MGADPNIIEPEGIPLIWYIIVDLGEFDLAELMITKYGANINALDLRGRTMFQYAYGHENGRTAFRGKWPGGTIICPTFINKVRSLGYHHPGNLLASSMLLCKPGWSFNGFNCQPKCIHSGYTAGRLDLIQCLHAYDRDNMFLSGEYGRFMATMKWKEILSGCMKVVEDNKTIEMSSRYTWRKAIYKMRNELSI